MKKQPKKKNNNLIFFKLNQSLLLIYLFFLPTQFGKHFFFNFSFLQGVRSDYLAPTFYFLDFIFLLLICLNLKTILRSFSNKYFLLLILMLVFNIVTALNFSLATIKSLRIIQWLVIFFLFKQTTLSPKKILLTLFINALIQLFLVSYQFYNGHALQGIFYFLGERYFHLGTISIAKINLLGKEFLRPYGTFSHPNSLAGFYLLLYVFILTKKYFNQAFWLKNLVLLIFSLLIFLSFSKTAILVFILILFIFYLSQKNSCRVCTITHLFVIIVCSIIFLLGQTDPLSLVKRLVLANQALKIIQAYPLLGVGLNNYLLAQTKFNNPLIGLFNQPVHNLFLLIIAEIGLVNSGLILWLGKQHLKKQLKENYLLTLVIVLTGITDHYWWTLPQNFFLLAFVLGSLKKD